MTSLLDAALRYAAHGWPVLPCRPRRKDPATPHGLKDATTDPGLIGAWWEQWPDANVAVRTGRQSGIVVIDVDGDEGHACLRALEAKHGTLPRTASVVTPGGGRHVYFRHPGRELRNSAGQLAPAVDCRGDGGYVLTPPSEVQQRRYELDERAPLAPLPEWLLQALTAPQTMNGARGPEPASTWLRMVRAGLPEGQRNDGLARLIGHLIGRDVNADLALELAHLVNGRCKPPLPAREVERIHASIVAREVTRRTKNTRSAP